MTDKRHFPFWVLTLAVFIALIVPMLVQDGMFMDGLIYSCVSKNLSHGIGTWWFPEFNHFGLRDTQSFHEHPPLVFWLQSVFFTLMGDSLYVERFYSFFTACATAYIIVLIWKLVLNENAELRKLGWIPILLWIVVPVCFWSYQHNMHENTMGVFTLLSVYFSLKGFFTGKNSLLNIILSGAFIFAAYMSKGLPGLFPLTTVFCYWLATRNISFRKMIGYSLVLFFVPVLIYLITILDENAMENLTIYIKQRVLYRIQNEPTAENRFYTIGRLVSELLPSIALCIIIMVSSLTKFSLNNIKKHSRQIFLFLMIGGSAALPLMLTLVQKGFYIVPAFPFFAIALALAIAPSVNELISRINFQKKAFRIFKMCSVALVIIVIAFSFFQFGKIKRDSEKLHDIYLMGKIIPAKSIIKVSHAIYNDWSLQGYMIRHFNISIDPFGKEHAFFLLDKNDDTLSDSHYQKVEIETEVYNLYVLKAIP